MVVGESEWSA